MKKILLETLVEYCRLGIPEQLDYSKFYMYSIITHSTAIEGSTVTEVENQLLFDEGISASKRNLHEQMMNLDLKAAYELSRKYALEHRDFSKDLLKQLSAAVMKNTGSVYNTLQGSFDSSAGDFRKLNVSAGAGGRSYLSFTKIEERLDRWCSEVNKQRAAYLNSKNIYEKYLFTFDAHFDLVTIHPWADGNGRTSRRIMNHLQTELNLIPAKVMKEDKADYIQALIDAREKSDKTVFSSFMIKNHIKNLQKEIEEFKKSREFAEKEFSGIKKEKGLQR